MPNPFSGLMPALKVILEEGRVLPATGQAMEDLTRPDHEEVIDRLRTGDEQIFDVLLEAPNRQPYVSLQPVYRTERHLLRYFLDGSARTYFLGDVIEGNRRSPVHVAQIGAAAVYRTDNGRIKVAGIRHKIVLMMDKQAVSFGERVEELVNNAGPLFAFHDTMEDDGETEISSPGKEPRSRAAHKAHHLMAVLEDELGRSLARPGGQWLVLDGSLSKDLFRWHTVPQFLGVAKSFNRQPRFKLPGARGGRVVNLYDLLADLPFSARTCAFAARAGKMAVWYVRIREQKHLDYPLMGVLKVEYPNFGMEAVPSELINEISGALIAERQVAPYGKDSRWHAHLYAIYLAEQAIKNSFISIEVLKAGLKWPLDVQGL
ncbi:hypothetical protein [Moorella sulfitireducens (nom. illeg.)]|uniref:hypothetical protein n=1 Tax=Neomoorella sulfitireducens TaxID=2972948 RepID=UPI0021ACEF07|nr:hypothetical protein [Moorella sulfitireducens]